MSSTRAKILGIRSALPASSVTNEMLAAEFPDWDVRKIYDKTGICQRRIAAPDECASDLGVAAAQRLFADGLAAPQDIDFLLFCTQSPDYPLPTTACLLQHRLGLSTSCGALDFNLGCSGFVYGLSLATGLIETGQASKVLLITAETYSKFLHPKDKSVRTIFGDGAAATLIGAVQSEHPLIGPFLFGSDGRGGKNLIVRTRGARGVPAGEAHNVNKAAPFGSDYLFMNGPEIYTFTLRAVPPLVAELLERAKMSEDQVDYFLLHQANAFMLDALRSKMKLPSEKVGFYLENVGNTVSATIPMALELLQEKGQIKAGCRLMLVGFGVGYSWAGCMAEL